MARKNQEADVTEDLEATQDASSFVEVIQDVEPVATIEGVVSVEEWCALRKEANEGTLRRAFIRKYPLSYDRPSILDAAYQEFIKQEA